MAKKENEKTLSVESAPSVEETAPIESVPEKKETPIDEVKACFDFNAELQELHQTSDGKCFYKIEDASAHAYELENKLVKTHKRP